MEVKKNRLTERRVDIKLKREREKKKGGGGKNKESVEESKRVRDKD